MKENNKIGSILLSARKKLQAAGKENAALDAELLLMEVMGISGLVVFTWPERLLSEAQVSAFWELVERRAAGEPLQYLLGHCEFMGMSFQVGEGVLIPRGDTEVLVEEAIQYCKDFHYQVAVDICTGSGCIPICLSRFGYTEVYGTDISEKALSYARKNNASLHGNVTFYQGDLFEALPSSFKGNIDVITSNPPYIARAVIPTLMEEVRDFEPSLALDGGLDGLDFYRRIIAEAGQWLKAGGRLLLEIGYDQRQAVSGLCEAAGLKEIVCKQDLSGLDRVITARKALEE